MSGKTKTGKGQEKMFLDYYYFIWVLPAVIFAFWTQAKVGSTFKKYSSQFSSRGLTGAQAARRVLDANGLYQVKIEPVGGSLTDHYDPRTRVIRLSQSVYDKTSTAAIGVAAHEAGHAIQHDRNYVPVKIRSALIPITNIGSSLGAAAYFYGPFVRCNQPFYGKSGLCGSGLLRSVRTVPAGDSAYRI